MSSHNNNHAAHSVSSETSVKRQNKMGGPSMHGSSFASSERPQKGTWKKLLAYCKRYWIAIIIALVCAAAGSVITLVGPNKLGDLTNIIVSGITPNEDAFREVAQKSAEQFAAVQMGKQIQSIEIDGEEISPDDQMAFLEIMSQLNGSGHAPETSQNVGDASSMGSLSQEDQDKLLDKLSELPASIQHVIEPEIDVSGVLRIAVFLAILYLAGAGLSALQGLIMASVTQRVIQKMRFDLSRKINSLPMAYFQENTTGDILSRITNDADSLGSQLNSSIGMLVSATTLFFGSLIMMFVTNVVMALSGILATLAGFVLMSIIMAVSQRYFTRQQNALGTVNGYVEEMYSGHTIVQAYNGRTSAIREFEKLNEDLRKSGFKAQSLSGLMTPLMTFIGNLGYVAVCVVGASLALNGQIEFGVIVSFMMYIRLFTQPFSQFAQGAQALQTVGAAASRIFGFLAQPDMPNEDNKPIIDKPVKGYVDFEHVRFGYTKDIPIIKDFSARVKPGQKIAIVGPTGAGKTTLMNLLMRFYEIDSGKIAIEGISTKAMRREQVHSDFCMVLQDAWVFEGTVRENLMYATEGASEEQMHEAAQKVGLDHFISTLPEGYDTILNDQINLSQGQRQQLTIARAMIADRPMLILDEATSSIDTRTELAIQDAMDHLMKGRTSFVIAHRLSTIRNADLILVIRDGDIVERGTHEELLKANGFYAELYNSQFAEQPAASS